MMSNSGPPPPNQNPGIPLSTVHQDELNNFCRARNARLPEFQTISDRRGGRTAWSCIVHVQGANIQARFWYDGQYLNSAREDAAERALQYFGVLPPPPGAHFSGPRPPSNPGNGN